YRGANQAIAGFLGESGFEAIRPDGHRQQGIAVVLTDLVPSEFALAVTFIIVGIGLDDVAGGLCRPPRPPAAASGQEGRSNCRRSTWSGQAHAPAWSSAPQRSTRCRKCPPPTRYRRRWPIG